MRWMKLVERQRWATMNQAPSRRGKAPVGCRVGRVGRVGKVGLQMEQAGRVKPWTRARGQNRSWVVESDSSVVAAGDLLQALVANKGVRSRTARKKRGSQRGGGHRSCKSSVG